MNKAKLIFSALFVLISVSLSAQNAVTGKIVDNSTGEGVPYASVMVKGTMTGVSSDVDGVYTISAPANGTLVFSAVGYTTAEIAVDSKSIINVNLDPDTEFLEETIVVGYGSAKKVNSLVGSVQTVNSETLKNAPSSSALDQLQGQVAGLQVLSYSGVSGDNAVSIQLHGDGSLGAGSSPLYVIDGIPTSSRAIMSMNPNDIESISVLKDASATSIYGSRASSGVIYITTKTGAYNEQASVTVRSQYGVSTLANTKLYESMMTSSELMDFWVRTGMFTEEYIKKTFIDKGYTNSTKWWEYTMSTVNPQSQNDVTIQGGGRKVAYMVSASQFDQQGFTPGNYYQRYTVRSNVQGHPLSWLKFGTNFAFSLDKTQFSDGWGSSKTGPQAYTDTGLSYLMLPMYPTHDENGEPYPHRLPGSNIVNPYFYMETHPDVYNRYSVNGNVFVQISPVKNLTFTSRAGVDGYIELNNWEYLPSYSVASGSATAQVGKATEFDYSATITNTVEYVWDINYANKLTFLLGQEGVANDYSYYYASSKKQTDDRLMLLGNGSQPTFEMGDQYSQSKFLSFFGHVDYTLQDKYFLDAVIRNDAVSRFGADVRNAMFWSAGARWNVKKEDFLKYSDLVNDLNFKVSYGTQGNANIGDYPSLGLISASSQYSEMKGLAVTKPANNKLTWENQHLLTVSLSGRVFDALDFNVEFYRRNTTSMLMAVPNPYTSYFTSVNNNVGELQNQGIDLTLGLDILRGPDYFLRANTTFSYNKQEVIELFDGRQSWEMTDKLMAYVVGLPVVFYTPIYAGVDPEDGMPMWYLPGEDKSVTTMDPERTTKTYDQASLSQNTGKPLNAPITGGFSLSGAWKGLSFTADFAYTLGKYLGNNDRIFYENPYQYAGMNTHKAVSDYWTPDNTDAEYPAWNKGAAMKFDTHVIEDASFLRLKNLQVGYSLPKSLLGWTNGVLGDVKFTVTGRNLLTFTNYTGIDPEAMTNLTYGVAGNSKQILGGIEITF